MDDSLSVIIAPDSFKGTVSASNAADAIAEGWRAVRPGDVLTILPQADGGEGTLDAIEHAVPGALRHNAGLVTGPDGQPTPGAWLELPDGAGSGVGVVELAQCSGLPLMHSPDPLGATTRGLGEVILAALDAGMHSLAIALGGSASTDGGTGALAALGLRLFDKNGRELRDGGGALARLSRCEREMTPPPRGGVTLLTDVTAPLLGRRGAANVYGPQKGADTTDIARLESGLSTLARHLRGNPTAAGSGAAGGTAYGFAALWGAHIESGAKYVQRVTGLDTLIGAGDVVVTGEGRFDPTSAAGKVVGELISLASHTAANVGIVAGTFTTASGHWECSLSTLAGSADASVADPLRYLELAGRAAAAHFTKDQSRPRQ